MKQPLNLTFKKATPEDVDAYLELEQTAVKSKTYSAILDKEEALQEFEENEVYMIYKDGQVVGSTEYQMKSPNHAYLAGLIIKPEFQSQGTGREAVLFRLKKLEGIERIDVVTHPENFKILHMYQSLGFKVEKRVENYFGDGEPRLVLARERIIMTNETQKIKAIAFDFGGVIELNDGTNIMQKIADNLGVDFETLRSEYYRHNHLSNVDNLNWSDMFLKVVAVFNNSKEKAEEVAKILKEYNGAKYINQELLGIMTKLKEQNYKIAILSNATTELRNKLAATGIDKLVDVVVISGETGYQKPHPEIFKILFERLEVEPFEVIFIDDNIKSLETAEDIGYLPILYKTNDQLLSDLKTMGVFI